MHLTHKLPWNQLADNFEFVSGGLCLRKGVTPKTIQPSLMHFSRCLATALREFALTEVARLEEANGCSGLNVPLKADPDTPLFSEALLDLSEHPFGLRPHARLDYGSNALTADCRRLSYWVERAGGPEGHFSTEQGDLADALKLLVQLGESEALLRLSEEPPCLSGMYNMSWGHSFGVNHIEIETLPRYILMNLGYAVRQRTLSELQEALADPTKRPIDPVTGLPRGLSPRKQWRSLYELYMFRSHARGAAATADYCSQLVMHNAFWTHYSRENMPTHQPWYKAPCLARSPPWATDPTVVPDDDPTVADPARARQYLSDCFRSLYLYHMIQYGRSGGDVEHVAECVERAVMWAFKDNWATHLSYF